MTNFGGRKFLALLLMLGIAGLQEYLGKNGISTNFVTLMLGLYAAFTAGNAGVTIASLRTAPPANPPPDAAPALPEPVQDFQPAPPPFDPQPVYDSLARIEQKADALVAGVPGMNQAVGFLVKAEQARQSASY